MARKQQQQPIPIPTAEAEAAAEAVTPPISFSQARQRRRPGKPQQATPGKPQSAADRLASRVWLAERIELTGRLDPYHAYRGGYWQGALDALDMLEALVTDGVDLETTLAELRAWLKGDSFGQWVNAPLDPHEIAPWQWLERRNGSSSSQPSQPAQKPSRPTSASEEHPPSSA